MAQPTNFFECLFQMNESLSLIVELLKKLI